MEDVCYYLCPWSDTYFVVDLSFSWLVIPGIDICGTGFYHLFDLGIYAWLMNMFSGSCYELLNSQVSSMDFCKTSLRSELRTTICMPFKTSPLMIVKLSQVEPEG